ncbi:Glycosyl hydrolases family 35 [Agreia pratensis]|uniref:Glycosyl hydrolases family 35 n=1 Tax=Agreia pratensis TaxID=150121 RepID=A0A1X7J9N7_9MICO|nr:Glycosyl hydrolases family 35 [Agreia pratensis]
MGHGCVVTDFSTPGAPQRIRLSNSPTSSSISTLRLGDGAPDDAIVVREGHLERGGMPWFPVAGEYHYARTDPKRWREDLAALRSNGITLVSTYAIWILHQEQEGPVSWKGALDLRRFVEEARSVGLEVVLRIGPWVHGETRNGGFPDWVQSAAVVHRTDDPAYLDLVRPWIEAMAEELSGLFRSADDPSAPIVAIQVENELYDQPAHLSTLRRMAEDAGMTAPLWTATGWGGAQLPPNEFLPVFAGYVDGFWEDSDAGWPANYEMHFRFTAERDDLGVGADVRAAAGISGEIAEGAEGDADTGDDAGGTDAATRVSAVPYATCELGGGMPVAYHRRPFVDSDDVAAVALAKIASGSVFQGYYMYHGGVQVLGRESSTQESHATGYPNDVPVRDYDFAAPIGAFGQRRRHADLLRLQHLFVQTAATELAPLTPSFFDGDVRASFRADDEQGFVFFSTYQPAVAPLPAAEVQFELTTGEHSTVLPSKPTHIPSGEFFVWPVRRLLPDGSRFSATAQLVADVELGGMPTIVLFQTAGVPVEIIRETASGETEQHLLPALAVPTLESTAQIGGARVIVVDEPTAESLWLGRIHGELHLVLSTSDVTFDGGLNIRIADTPVTFSTLPALARIAAGVERINPSDDLLARYSIDAAPLPVAELDVVLESAALAAAPVRHGGSSNRLSAPLADDFDLAARYRVGLSDAPAHPSDRHILQIDWVGDAGRAMHGDEFISDQFWSGRPWEIDVTELTGELTLSLLPWSADSLVHLDGRIRPEADRAGLAVYGARVHRSRLVRVTA